MLLWFQVLSTPQLVEVQLVPTPPMWGIPTIPAPTPPPPLAPAPSPSARSLMIFVSWGWTLTPCQASPPLALWGPAPTHSLWLDKLGRILQQSAAPTQDTTVREFHVILLNILTVIFSVCWVWSHLDWHGEDHQHLLQHNLGQDIQHPGQADILHSRLEVRISGHQTVNDDLLFQSSNRLCSVSHWNIRQHQELQLCWSSTLEESEVHELH